MSCTCYDDMLKKVKEKVIEQLPDNTIDGSLDIQWDGKVLRLDGKKNDVMLRIKYDFRRTKTNGEPRKNLEHCTVSISPSHCPFCGKKFDDQ